MRLFKGVVPPDPYRGLPSKLHSWVDRCNQYYYEWLLRGASNQINGKRIALDLESSVRRAKDKALKDFERFIKHLDDRGISEQAVQDSQDHAKGLLASYLVDDLEVELQHRGMDLNAVFEAIEAALTSTPSTRREGRPAKDETRVVLFLWSKLRTDGLSSMRTASRVIAVVLNKDAKRFSESIYQTIRNAEIK